MSLTGTPCCTFLTAWGDVLFHSLGGSPRFLIGLYSLTRISAFLQGYIAAPLTFYCSFWWVASLSRDSNPGWGDWRRSLCGLGLVVFFVLFLGNFKSVRFACHATGLDAVQRLEQKKEVEQVHVPGCVDTHLVDGQFGVGKGFHSNHRADHESS